jgi:hypothetical protein
MKPILTRKSERGASLFMALIMLVAMSILALGSLTTSLMEVRMAGNSESTMSAFASAQAGVEVADNNSDSYFVVNGVKGDTRCFGYSGCTNTIGSVPQPLDASYSKLRVTRTTDVGCPPRTKDNATSCAKQNATTFVTESEFDGTVAGKGRAELVQGYIQLIPVVQDTTTAPPVTGSYN